MAKAKPAAQTIAPPKAGEAAATWEPVASLEPWSDNPRNISEEAVAKLAKVIKRFGWSEPIVAQEGSRRICAGHRRFRAAKLLKLDVVPVRFMPLSDEDAELLAVADNRLGEDTDWDSAKLTRFFANVRRRGQKAVAELEAEVAFTADEIGKMLESEQAAASRDAEATLAEAQRDTERATENGGDGDANDSAGDQPVYKSASITYNLVFETEVQQQRWYEHLRKLKSAYPDAATVGERVLRFVDEHASA